MDKNGLYRGMLNDLASVNLTGRQRARAESQMRTAVMFIEMLLGPTPKHERADKAADSRK